MRLVDPDGAFHQAPEFGVGRARFELHEQSVPGGTAATRDRRERADDGRRPGALAIAPAGRGRRGPFRGSPLTFGWGFRQLPRRRDLFNGRLAAPRRGRRGRTLPVLVARNIREERRRHPLAATPRKWQTLLPAGTP